MKNRLLFAALVGLIGSAIATSSEATGSATAGKRAVKPAAASSKAKPVKPAAKATTKPAPEAPAAPIADTALAGIYSGKTWLWPDGAAYFAPDGGFVAFAGKNKTESFARGSWRIASNGRLCFKATWVSRGGAGAAESCFAHQVKSGDVLQRKEPSGQWYVFKHRESRPDDEFRKLVAGDQAGAEADRIREIFRRG